MTQAFSMPIPNGFRRQKKKNNSKNERQEKVNNFLNEYKNLCEEHNLKLDAYFNYTPRGQKPVIDVLFLKVPIKYDGKPELIQKDKKEISKLVEPFLAEYEILKKKHMIYFVPMIEIADDGIFPKLSIKDLPVTKTDVNIV
jgi:hypothetical protein